MNFEVQEPSVKVFSMKFWGMPPPTYVWFQAIRESFLHEILTSHGSVKVFSLESLPLCIYGMNGAN